MPDATHAQFEAEDGHTTFLRLKQLEGAVLAYTINGKDLTHDQGYPVRLIVPGVYGYKMPKWIRRVMLTLTPQPGFYEAQGWPTTGDVQTMSYICTPHHREVVNGTVKLSGIAFAGLRKIVQIEVSVDDAPWMPVNFEPGLPGASTNWQIDWTPPAPGDYLLKVRATDSQGYTQSDFLMTTPFPDGWNAIHSIVVRVRAIY
jgi:hypothetical protein